MPRKSRARSAAFLEANRHEQRSTAPRNVRGEAPSSLNASLSRSIRKSNRKGKTYVQRRAPSGSESSGSRSIRKSNRKGEAYASNTNVRRKCKLLKKSHLVNGQGEKKGGTPKTLGYPDKCMKNKATEFEMLGYPDILLKTNEISLLSGYRDENKWS